MSILLKTILSKKMEEKRMIKKVICVVSAIGIITMNIIAPPENVYADNLLEVNEPEDRHEQVIDYTNNASNLIDNADEDNAMTMILKDNKDNNSGRLSEDVEVTLNEIGVFDDEIQDFPDELVNLMEDGCQYSVYINYSEVSSDGATKSLSEDEVNDYFEEKLKEEKKDKLESFLGIENVNVAAYSKNDEGKGLSDSGILKQVLILSQTGAGGKIYVNYYANWLGEPLYRNTDAFAVTLKNASIDKASFSCTYIYEYKDSFFVNYVPTTNFVRGSVDIKKNGKVVYSMFGVAVSFDLYGSLSEKRVLELGGTTRKYVTDKVYMGFTATVDNKKDMNYIIACGDYWHQKTSASINVAFSLKDASISISPSIVNNYDHISDNVYVKFYFK